MTFFVDLSAATSPQPLRDRHFFSSNRQRPQSPFFSAFALLSLPEILTRPRFSPPSSASLIEDPWTDGFTPQLVPSSPRYCPHPVVFFWLFNVPSGAVRPRFRHRIPFFSYVGPGPSCPFSQVHPFDPSSILNTRMGSQFLGVNPYPRPTWRVALFYVLIPSRSSSLKVAIDVVT